MQVTAAGVAQGRTRQGKRCLSAEAAAHVVLQWQWRQTRRETEAGTRNGSAAIYAEV